MGMKKKQVRALGQVHTEILMEWLQEPSREIQMYDFGRWVRSKFHESLSLLDLPGDEAHRIRPAHIVIGDQCIEGPLTKAPRVGDVVFVLSLASPVDKPFNMDWKGTPDQVAMLESRICFDSLNTVRAAHLAVLGLLRSAA